ncbi:MAG TPA: lysophospholipid acyltransferase family protein, partial [Gemmataceae bacterium]|nr:lysophospholipid acyltransferase family protein [Gemmataceae bacterium]
ALLVGLRRLGVLAAPPGRLGLLALLTAAAVPAAWWLFFRQFAEEAGAVLLGPFYRVRLHGPGVEAFPEQGPLLVLANHAAWFDPLWLCKALPRRMTPLMISSFYDKPVLHWLMARVVRAIRVLDSPYRREAPELREAVAVLDRGGCVLIFPEGVLRRKDEVPLRPFGQGVWRILRERPATPVVVCWIEGGWGSLTSHFEGPPLTHKPLDWLRPIDIAVEPPRVLDPALLADPHAARRWLYQACLDAGRHLGLTPPTPAPLAEEAAARPD